MIPKYDVPHLSIACRGRTDPKECLAVNYTITVLNDSNMILGPIYIRDNFPSGTEFVNASIEPSDLTPRYAEWSITTLRIGESATIDLRLKVTREIDKLTNRAVGESIYEKKSGHDIQEKKVRAYSTSDVMVDWEMCRLPKLSASMTAELDYSTPTIADYKLIIQNLADYKMTVNVTDRLPEGMMFLNSTIEPSRIEEDELMWVLEDLAPRRRVVISYTAEAKKDGLFVNEAHIIARSADGKNSTSLTTVAPIVIGKSVDESLTMESDWLPSDVNFDEDFSTGCVMI